MARSERADLVGCPEFRRNLAMDRRGFVKAGALGLESKDGEVAEPDIQPGLGIAVQIAAPGSGVGRRTGFEAIGATDQRDARMGKRIALSGLAEEKRAALKQRLARSG